VSFGHVPMRPSCGSHARMTESVDRSRDRSRCLTCVVSSTSHLTLRPSCLPVHPAGPGAMRAGSYAASSVRAPHCTMLIRRTA
jgi:hypothetical protein